MPKLSPSPASFTVESSLAGIHSRSEETVRVSREYDRGRSTKEALDKTFEQDAKNLVRLQIESGFTEISDGQISWQDFLRPFSESLVGLRSGADLSRWFDTNSFYRRPSVVKDLKLSKNSSFLEKCEIKEAFSILAEGEHNISRKKKIAIPGPYTLASLVENDHYDSTKELVFDFAKLVKKLLKSLAAAGFVSVQLNEPSLVYRYGESAVTNKKHLKFFLSAYEEYLSSPPVDVCLHTYFGDCSKILKDLLELEGISSIGVDFTQTSLDSIEKVKFRSKSLACGCVDGRNSLIESPEWISDFCVEATRTLKPAGLLILPSCELKYLPRAYADQKIRSIGKAANIVQKRGSG